ncbi:MAG TPA: 30S ribosomal protein S3, partial [Tetrasphaera australiensis]|nr:30S ribosomal protein S3 [Tetrasphaera australiensis]
AKTTFGRIGVKVWIYKGDMTEKEFAAQQVNAPRGGARGPRRDRDDRPARARRDAAPATTETAEASAPAAEAVTEGA